MLTSEITKKDRELHLTCSCGCDSGINFRYNWGEIFVSAVEGYFYARQIGRTREKIRLLKNKCVLDICITESELFCLKSFLEYADQIVDRKRKDRNKSHIEVEHSTSNIYTIYIMSDLSFWGVVFNRYYHAGEIVLSDEDRIKLIEDIEKAFESKPYFDNI